MSTSDTPLRVTQSQFLPPGIRVVRLSEVEQLQAALATARRELEEARRDSQRLDWLEALPKKHGFNLAVDCPVSDNDGWAIGDIFGMSVDYFANGPTLREAIDAAREASK